MLQKLLILFFCYFQQCPSIMIIKWIKCCVLRLWCIINGTDFIVLIYYKNYLILYFIEHKKSIIFIYHDFLNTSNHFIDYRNVFVYWLHYPFCSFKLIKVWTENLKLDFSFKKTVLPYLASCSWSSSCNMRCSLAPLTINFFCILFFFHFNLFFLFFIV